jgi:NAD(P)H-dependent FMN reductase
MNRGGATLSLKVILGTTRQSRFGDKPAHWICEEASRLPNVEAELLDLRDYPMPFFDQPRSPAWGTGTYEDPTVQRWADRIAAGDAFIVVSPEYNHGYPAVLKNAVDHIYAEWAQKPVGFLSYGNTGGARAVEQLRLVAVEMQMWPIRSAIHLPVDMYLAVMNEPVPANPELFEPLKKGRVNVVERFFNELLWAAWALKRARAGGVA